MTCDTYHPTCGVCGRRICQRCARCYERVPAGHPGTWDRQCPSRLCRFIKSLPFTRG